MYFGLANKTDSTSRTFFPIKDGLIIREAVDKYQLLTYIKNEQIAVSQPQSTNRICTRVLYSYASVHVYVSML